MAKRRTSVARGNTRTMDRRPGDLQDGRNDAGSTSKRVGEGKKARDVGTGELRRRVARALHFSELRSAASIRFLESCKTYRVSPVPSSSSPPAGPSSPTATTTEGQARQCSAVFHLRVSPQEHQPQAATSPENASLQERFLPPSFPLRPTHRGTRRNALPSTLVGVLAVRGARVAVLRALLAHLVGFR